MDALAPTSRSRLAAPRRLLRLRSDAALAERFADGDEAAFAILFERHRASVLAVCIGVLGSRHDAEDATQETFAALAVSLRNSPPRELRAWLARVARNAAIDVARRRRARESINGALPDGDAWAPDGVTISHGLKDELESVVAGIRELPESQRTALLMRELAGHSYKEIADLLELDEDAVRGLIARARIGLRLYREAAELPCATARAAIATEPDGRRHDRTIRRHIRGCSACRAYRRALRDDAKALRGLMPMPAGGAAGGGAVIGGIAAKGALLGTAVTQVTAACAVSVCAVGGIALLAPGTGTHRRTSGTISLSSPRHHVVRVGAASAATTPADHSASGPTSGTPVHVAAATAPGTSSTGRSGARITLTRGGSLPSVSARGVHSIPSGSAGNSHSGGSQPSGSGSGARSPGQSPSAGPGSSSGPSQTTSPTAAGGAPTTPSSASSGWQPAPWAAGSAPQIPTSAAGSAGGEPSAMYAGREGEDPTATGAGAGGWFGGEGGDWGDHGGDANPTQSAGSTGSSGSSGSSGSGSSAGSSSSSGS